MVMKKIFIWLMAYAASITAVNPAARAAVEAAAATGGGTSTPAGATNTYGTRRGQLPPGADFFTYRPPAIYATPQRTPYTLSVDGGDPRTPSTTGGLLGCESPASPTPLIRSVSITQRRPIPPTKRYRFDIAPSFQQASPGGTIMPIGCLYPTTTVLTYWKGSSEKRTVVPIVQRLGLSHEIGIDGEPDSTTPQHYAARSFGIFSTSIQRTKAIQKAVREIPLTLMGPGGMNPILGASSGTPEKEHLKKPTSRTGKTIASDEASTFRSAMKTSFDTAKTASEADLTGASIHFVGPYIGTLSTKECPIVVFNLSQDLHSGMLIPLTLDEDPLKTYCFRALSEIHFFFMASPSFWNILKTRFPNPDEMSKFVQTTILFALTHGDRTLDSALQAIYNNTLGYTAPTDDIFMTIVVVRPIIFPAASPPVTETTAHSPHHARDIPPEKGAIKPFDPATISRAPETPPAPAATCCSCWGWC